jgi:hypothetical protein
MEGFRDRPFGVMAAVRRGRIMRHEPTGAKEGRPMLRRVRKFAASPQGKRLEHKAMQEAKKPENRARIKGLGRRVRRH